MKNYAYLCVLFVLSMAIVSGCSGSAATPVPGGSGVSPTATVTPQATMPLSGQSPDLKPAFDFDKLSSFDYRITSVADGETRVMDIGYSMNRDTCQVRMAMDGQTFEYNFKPG